MSKKDVIMAIDTANEICSVALLSRDEILFEKHNNEGRNHSALIAPYVRDLIIRVQQSNLELVAVAVNGGPGSYTGLRIGASFAKGFCYAQQLPLINISGLLGMAYAYKKAHPIDQKEMICSMIDAGRMEVYYSLYDANLNLLTEPSAQIITEQSFAPYKENFHIHYIGTGVEKCKQILSHHPSTFMPMSTTASNMVNISFEMYDNKQFEDLAYWTPNYIKPYHAVVSKNKVLAQHLK